MNRRLIEFVRKNLGDFVKDGEFGWKLENKGDHIFYLSKFGCRLLVSKSYEPLITEVYLPDAVQALRYRDKFDKEFARLELEAELWYELTKPEW